MKIDEFYMAQALKEAARALDKDEVPVGAVIVYEGKMIARAHNQIKLLKDPTAHAEMIAITQAASYLGNERLINTTMYSTVEPCSMCAGALVLGRVRRLVYGAKDPKTGACGSVFNVTDDKRLNHRVKVTGLVLERECAALLKDFFSRRRGSRRKSVG
ncbi:MAG: tRNA adenosine(34) deaminase TadA [Candidatus Omnitrophica bacterium]|nr:tRNA adenosine(34) deaminase TadA [Candidatus Omnitrophota bacterium]